MHDFEDDGASFRVRRQRQLDQMFAQERVVIIDGRTGRLEKRQAPRVVKAVMWPIAICALAFAGILLVCIGDFILWSLGVPV